jgi:hypothetical protein
MVAVKEFSWEEVSTPDFGARAAFRAAVADIAAKAYEKLPECQSRIDSAVKIVLAGDVELQTDGTAKVSSQSNGTTASTARAPVRTPPRPPMAFVSIVSVRRLPDGRRNWSRPR